MKDGIAGFAIVALFIFGAFVLIPLIHYIFDFWISPWDEIHGHHCSHCSEDKQ